MTNYIQDKNNKNTEYSNQTTKTYTFATFSNINKNIIEPAYEIFVPIAFAGREGCANVQARQRICCSHTQILDVDEDSDKILDL